jgi:hypothetical protein
VPKETSRIARVADRTVPIFSRPGIGHGAKQAENFRHFPEAMRMDL